MHGARVRGTTIDLGSNTSVVDFVIVLKRSPPRQVITDYLFHYLAAGSEEECANHPERHAPHIEAPALLTYLLLRPRREKLADWSTSFLDELPERPREVLWEDNDVVIWSAG